MSARFIPTGWTEADVLHELLDPPTRAWVPFPGLEHLDRPDWMQLTCIHFPTGGLNEIGRAKLTEANADEVIEQTLAHYASRGLQFRWSVVPGSTPPDLAERLRKRGFVTTEILALTRSTSVLSERSRGPASPSSNRVTIERVTLDTVDEYSRVMAEGWGAPPGAMADYNRATLTTPNARARLFLARVDGEPAGVGAGQHFERSLYLIGGVVLPRFRRLGVYRALTQARLELAAAEGLPLATTRSIATTSAPLLLKQGWDEWFRFPSMAPPLPPRGEGRGEG